jgi:putative oxidoreductase
MSFSETISPLLGRCMLVWFFGTAGMHILNDWPTVSGQLDAHHVPVAPAALLVALIFIFLGCVSLLFGYHARHGAVLLFGLTGAAAFALHPFWQIADSAARAGEFEIFTRDVAICGGLLLMVGMGPGPIAIDNRTGGSAKGKRR